MLAFTVVMVGGGSGFSLVITSDLNASGVYRNFVDGIASEKK